MGASFPPGVTKAYVDAGDATNASAASAAASAASTAATAAAAAQTTANTGVTNAAAAQTTADAALPKSGGVMSGATTFSSSTVASNSRNAVDQGAVALTDAATIAVDASTGNAFTVTLGGNRTLGLPSNLKSGAHYQFFIYQDGTGSRTLAYAAGWKFPSGVAPTLTTTASALDVLSATYDGTNLVGVLSKAFS